MNPIQPQPIQLPISTAWMYMSDDQQYKTIPTIWSKINFKDVDVLNVGPAGIQSDGTFGLYKSPTSGDLANRFNWIIHTARSQNPNIKIIVSQWWGDGTGIWGDALDVLQSDAAVSKYTDSVAAFIGGYLSFSGGVDGYDIDYESNNVVDQLPTIVSQIRTKLDVLSKAKGGRPFYLTVSPATTAYLKPAVPALSFVNMQTYAGSFGLTPQEFTALGLKSQQLLYGICPETGCGTKSVQEVAAEYTSNKLGGIHLWRLNSDNYVEEGQWQAQIYSFLHPRAATADA
jgi:Glycosyl hydrolases family 18